MQIKELILKTSSLARTKLFYHKTLELEILTESDEAISFIVGKTILTFESTTEGKPYYHFAFNVINNKFSDSYEWIDNKLDILTPENGMPIVPYPDWNAQSFYFYDNNGSILEFITRFDLPYQSAEPFSTACITEISEIGIVTGNVEATSANLEKEHHIPYFAKGPRLSDFVPMGDDYGLLLVFQDKKGWMPTHKPAHIFPLTVVLEDGQTIKI